MSELAGGSGLEAGEAADLGRWWAVVGEDLSGLDDTDVEDVVDVIHGILDLRHPGVKPGGEDAPALLVGDDGVDARERGEEGPDVVPDAEGGAGVLAGEVVQRSRASADEGVEHHRLLVSQNFQVSTERSPKRKRYLVLFRGNFLVIDRN